MTDSNIETVTNHLSSYKNTLVQKINEIDNEVILEVISLLELASVNHNNIYIIGNGGSAATAAHMVNDFGVGLRVKGKLNLKISCLTDNIPTITATSNDASYSDIFISQLKNIVNEDDIVIAISCSGNSQNIIKAVKYAKTQKAKVVALTGFDGGELYNLADIKYHISTEKGKYGVVEDMHLIFDHIIYEYFLNK